MRSGVWALGTCTSKIGCPTEFANPHSPFPTPHSRFPMTYDVIIIGAGPAGSAVSTLLAREGLRALLLEKSRFPREKLCGEFITPDCLNVFDRLGVSELIFDAGAKIIDRWTLFS